MAAKLARMTHKRAIQLHLVAKNCTPGGQSQNFWIYPHMFQESGSPSRLEMWWG